MRRVNLTTIIVICFVIVLYITLDSTLLSFNSINSRVIFGNKAAKTAWNNYTAWHDCLANNISSYKGDPNGLWSNLWKGIKKCENIDQMKSLAINDFANSDETKRHILPKLDLPSVIVTLGIGHDTSAEEKLIKKLPQGSEFFGADPMHEINERLYTILPGKYFAFAVGAEAGLGEANVLANNSYTKKTVVNVDIIYFLKNIVKRTFIDDIWIDAEGAEYGIFDYFSVGGKFDANDISFCQFNIEIHKPDSLQKKLFHDFIFGLLKDKRYAIYRPVQGYHMRLFMLNFNNDECIFKYIL
uniref:Methyltransf_21 domain-containing protein n=2 Tax=Caenorhabditis japonica TaxID=281687 RepID=A0A8R1HPD8_CAEJA